MPEADAREFRRAWSELIRVYNFRNRMRTSSYGLTVTEASALEVLAEWGPLSLNEMAAQLGSEKSTASRVVDRLVEKGYVARQKHPESRRSILVRLTPEGERLQQAIERDSLSGEMRILEDFRPEVRQAVMRLLARLTRATQSGSSPT